MHNKLLGALDNVTPYHELASLCSKSLLAFEFVKGWIAKLFSPGTKTI